MQLRTTLLSLFLLLTGVFGNFTGTIEAQESDQRARQILDGVNRKYSAIKAYDTDFTLSIENKDAGIDETQSGELTVKGDQYRLRTEELVRISDGTNIWTVFLEDEEVHVAELDPEDNELTPTRIFDIYNKGFLFLYVGTDELEDGRTVEVIDLTPLNKDLSYYKVRLIVDQNDSSIYLARAYSKNGTRFTYSLSNFDSNPTPHSDDYFVFNRDEFEGDYDVIDLR